MKTNIPHVCFICGKKTLWFTDKEKNYTYFDKKGGVYTHKKCLKKKVK